jgi:hypothetical protein
MTYTDDHRFILSGVINDAVSQHFKIEIVSVVIFLVRICAVNNTCIGELKDLLQDFCLYLISLMIRVFSDLFDGIIKLAD